MFGVLVRPVYSATNKAKRDIMEYVNFKFGDLPRKEQLRLFEAWLNGDDMELYLRGVGEWVAITGPSWHGKDKYRVKPKLKTFGELTKEEQKELLYAHHYGKVEFLQNDGSWVLKSTDYQLYCSGTYRIKEL